MLQHVVQTFLIAAVLSPFSYAAGRAAAALRLPAITGYLVSGIVCGPYALGILSPESVADLSIIEGACLGVIGLAAGAELHLGELNRTKKQVVSLTAGICGLTWVLCYYAFTWSASLTPVLPVVSRGQLAAIASLGGTLMMARSPASAIAVLKEMDAKGPFVSLVMGVVVLKDVVVIVLFALNMELVPLIINHDSSSFGLAHVLLPFLSVGVSLSAGLLGGYAMSLALQHQAHAAAASLVAAARLAPGVPHAVVLLRCKQALVLGLSTAVFSVTRALEAEPLLACVTAGMLLANRRPGGAGAEAALEEPGALINSIMVVTNVAFFGLAGASLKLAAIADSVWVALVVFLARLAAIACGSWLGCRVGGVKSEAAARVFWMSMITQAGVAMGLARIAGTAFPGWGPAFQTVCMAVIMLNMLVGPPCFRSALIQVGEARAHVLPSAAAAGAAAQGLHRDLSNAHDGDVDGVVGRAGSKGKGARVHAGAGGLHSTDSGPLQLARTPPAGKLAAKSSEAGDAAADHPVVVISSGALLEDLGRGPEPRRRDSDD
ncbi:hypothetical protein HT031_000277 [Scenedesmus sp. PABB004]|nr:hypothetical protein HT031_000277 [Scenedesmus sp. PABB004]